MLKGSHAFIGVCAVCATAASSLDQTAFGQPPVPGAHFHHEADVLPDGTPRPQLNVTVWALAWNSAPLGGVFPAWVPVDPRRYFALEGEVVAAAPGDEAYPGPHVAFEDFPGNHYTNDFCFKVRPDKNYLLLLDQGERPDGSKQELIEVEWETGLGARNEANPCSQVCRQGGSAGFYTAGHTRGEPIWQWPTAGDRVHVEGSWVWDRGHPPANTEIHPPRLVAVTRKLPAPLPSSADAGRVWATRVDIFASSDGGALWNNRADAPPFVERVRMWERDYAFLADINLPRPSEAAQLRYYIEVHPGDTFTAPVQVQPYPGGSPDRASPHARVRLPWRRTETPDQAVFARTLYLYWDDPATTGAAPSASIRKFRVTLDEIEICKTHDDAGNGWDGEYRVFADAGGTWFFLNELQTASDILTDGLGDCTAPGRYPIARSVTVCVPEDGSFRIYAGGWEADGISERVMGKIIDPNSDYDAVAKWANDTNGGLLSHDINSLGADDDPIGSVMIMHSAADGFGVGKHAAESRGPRRAGHNATKPTTYTDPNRSFILHYHIEQVP